MSDLHHIVPSIEECVRESELQGRKLTVEGLSGFSGDMLIGLLQRVSSSRAASAGRCTYLEIGVFRGLTLLSVAASDPAIQCYGIDNFSQFDKGGHNEAFVRGNIEKLRLQNCTLINEDFESALLSLHRYLPERGLDVYFIDGPHDYRSQYLCLDFARPYLSPHAVVIVDDCNYEHVRMANRDWLLANPQFTLAFDAYTRCHPQNAALEEKERMLRGWWNGVNVIVMNEGGLLERLLPPVNDNRALYFNDHIVHADRFAADVPALLGAFRTMTQGHSGIARGLMSLLRLRAEFCRTLPRADYPALNTGSAPLVGARYAGRTVRADGKAK
jgi:hypothetical protein